MLLQIYIVKAFPDSTEEDGKEILEEEENMHATKAPKTGSNCESKSKKTKNAKQAIVLETNESASSQEHLPESSIDNEVKQQEANSTMKTRASQKKLQKKSKMPATSESKEEAQVESVKTKANTIVKPRGVNSGKKPKATDNLVQDAGELKKVEPVEAASKQVSPKPRKKPSEKLFRKRA